ncbi:VOC family protein [Halovulum sp. GXIMD14793]
MDIGNFSISLAVKDLAASKAFYEKLGFEVFHEMQDQGWMILKGSGCTIGLFQGMFEGNILTFNPGWDDNAQPVDTFEDVRDIQKRLKADGITLISEADETTKGPASCTLTDPDGNVILIDQHV